MINHENVTIIGPDTDENSIAEIALALVLMLHKYGNDRVVFTLEEIKALHGKGTMVATARNGRGDILVEAVFDTAAKGIANPAVDAMSKKGPNVH